MKCTACEKPLSGGIDTFGPTGWEFCWECWSDLGGQDESHYGLAPHVHELSKTGSFLGSTVFTDEQDDRFTPDPDAPNLGVWTLPPTKGWR